MPKTTLSFYLHIIAIAVIVVSLSRAVLPLPLAGEGGVRVVEAAKESVYDRVMRTGVIRCGYWVAAPLIIKDPNTGAISGAYAEYIEALGKALNLKIEWAGEINLGTYLQDLNQGKFDAECATGWPNALRGKQVEYTSPIGYLPMYAYAKEGNTSFDNNLDSINDPSVRFSGHDGGTNTLVQQKFFPKSQLISVTGDVGFAEPLNMIKYGKADVTVVTSFEGEGFISSNPNSIRKIPSSPIRIISINISVAANEIRLLNMLNTATYELLYDGTIESFFTKYKIEPSVLLRVAKPYQIPTTN